jgi:hypothetical protein
MGTSYNLHFVNYNMGKKQVTQLILVVIWKQVYTNYQMVYLDLIFVKEILKYHLCNTLKEFK